MDSSVKMAMMVEKVENLQFMIFAIRLNTYHVSIESRYAKGPYILTEPFKTTWTFMHIVEGIVIIILNWISIYFLLRSSDFWVEVKVKIKIM